MILYKFIKNIFSFLQGFLGAPSRISEILLRFCLNKIDRELSIY